VQRLPASSSCLATAEHQLQHSMAHKPPTVKVLHRAIDGQSSDGDSPHSTGSPQQQLQALKAEMESLKQRLDQVRTAPGTPPRIA
jgi:hypothetical protein